MQNTSALVYTAGTPVSIEDILVDTVLSYDGSSYDADTGIATIHGTEIDVRRYAIAVEALPPDVNSEPVTAELWKLVEAALAN